MTEKGPALQLQSFPIYCKIQAPGVFVTILT